MQKLTTVILIIFFTSNCLKAQNTKEKWDSYISIFEDKKPGSITLRMDLITIAPLKKKPFILVTGLNYNSNRKDGLPEDETFEKLDKIEQELSKFLNKNCKNIIVGSFIHNYELLNYFYIEPNSNIKNKLQKFYSTKYPKYKYYINIKEDKSWSYYKDFLYPNEETKSYMDAQSILKKINESKDNFSPQKKIEYWISFENKKDFKNFKLEIIKQGFKIEKTEVSSKNSPTFKLKIWKNSKADINSIYPIISELKEMAKNFNGKYEEQDIFSTKK